jgi:ABC-type antimicrobial peptide transport system permease subunit
MESVVDRAMATWNLSVWMFGLFAAAAVLLVCGGLFSTVSLDAARRSREFALRIALGARARDIARHVLASPGIHVLGGISVGLLLAALGTQWMTALLFGVQPLDALTYAGVLALTALAIGLGGFLPAYRATRIDPGSLLRRNG